MHRAFEIRFLVTSGRKVNLLLVRERRLRLLFHEDFTDGATTIRAKAESGLLARRGR